jgi:hypothetical protein
MFKVTFEKFIASAVSQCTYFTSLSGVGGGSTLFLRRHDLNTFPRIFEPTGGGLFRYCMVDISSFSVAGDDSIRIYKMNT